MHKWIVVCIHIFINTQIEVLSLSFYFSFSSSLFMSSFILLLHFILPLHNRGDLLNKYWERFIHNIYCSIVWVETKMVGMKIWIVIIMMIIYSLQYSILRINYYYLYIYYIIIQQYNSVRVSTVLLALCRKCAGCRASKSTSDDLQAV